MKKVVLLICLVISLGCKEDRKEIKPEDAPSGANTVVYAKGFSIRKASPGLTVIEITSPWPNAENVYSYALISREALLFTTLEKDAYDAIITVPVDRIVVTSTTHIPALEALGMGDRLVGFPDSRYISSESTRKRIDAGKVADLGNNESINSEMTIALNPDIVIGFSIDNKNKAYETIQRSNIPVVYNGDWTEETPLGKAEWIKFFAPFFMVEEQADSIFRSIESSYQAAKALALKASNKPTVLSGALYKDVWYLPGGKSWASKFLQDANTEYLWGDTKETGSLSLSLESVLEKAKNAEYWVAPSQFTSYVEMEGNNRHYRQFKAFRNQKVYTYASTTGAMGGILYYELGPSRPDLVLKDLIHIFHPELLPDHEPFFFKPLQ